MYTHPYIQSELARVHREELLRDAARIRTADLLPRSARPAPTGSLRTAVSALAGVFSRPLVARAA